MPFTATLSRVVVAGLLVAAAPALATACRGYGGRADGPVTAVSPPPSGDGRNLRPAPGSQAACSPDMLRFHAGPLPRRDGRMLLTVTNISNRTCDFATMRYPLLRFGDGRQAPLRPIGASRPLTPVFLKPDATAYATVVTGVDGKSGTGHRHHHISQFGVALAARAAPTQVGLDGAPVRVDPHTATVTYWQPSLAAARKW
ncbi:DUF4232 domain-containing protein [Streptomyces sioyaensis]|uniref:DUF4232 domain-containing protein n=1 Tax=Streptomyces sioyaensis TaxID=67364 RepID=UPI001F163E22|nr:DUF4232 domain-containing protein [Streptomyces sioyaensis]MCF3178063.1 DUF4232 domain-containing protein [Streptomyces sioyaensis]